MEKTDNRTKMHVMLEWKKKYIEALIDELHPSGDVLEVGFGLGYAADRIQSFKPKSHTIIESNPDTAKKALAWASKHPHVKIIQDTWKNSLPSLGIFDSLFYNDYPIESEIDMVKRINPEEIAQTSNHAKELLSMIESEISKIKMHYSDQEIDDFYEKVGKANLKQLPGFFKKLNEYGYITETQYKSTMKKYHLNNHASVEVKKSSDNMFIFLDQCLKNHMRKGSRFSCFSGDVTSKYEDSQFFENVITNPFIDYHEKLIPITVPKFSDYYKIDQGLIMVVEKFS